METETQRSHMKVEAEIGVVQPQGKECQEPPGAANGKEGFSLRAIRGNGTLPIL